MYAELAFENDALKNLIEKSFKARWKRESADYLSAKQQISIRRPCTALNLSTAAYYYRFKPKEDDAIIVSCLEELAESILPMGLKRCITFYELMYISET